VTRVTCGSGCRTMRRRSSDQRRARIYYVGQAEIVASAHPNAPH
jgi:hypothetical protein